MKDKQGIRTKALHSGWRSDPVTGAFGLPIYLSTGFEFRDTEHAANLFSLKESGYIYSRLGNPTVNAFEEGLNDLEGGVGCVACSSGQGAFMQLLGALCCAGDHLIIAQAVYGGTLTLIKNVMGRFGIESTFVDINHPCQVEGAIRDNTRGIICETIGNPGMNIAPLEALGKIAARNDIPLIVDNTFAPILCRPFEWGAHVVVYSTTKYISGMGNLIGGAVIDSGNMDWNASDKWGGLTQPDPGYHGITFTEHFGRGALCAKVKASIMRDMGASPSAFDAYLLHLSLATLPLRMEQHSKNAQIMAEYLKGHPQVEWVSYAGLPDHPQYDLARHYLPEGCGGMLAFNIRGGVAAGAVFLDNLKLIGHVANLGDARSLMLHPASTTQSQLTPEERAAAGIGEGMIRFSVGIENAEDIIADLDAAFAAVRNKYPLKK